MIESLTVGIPGRIVPRETTPDIAKFERVTGIKNTRRYGGNTSMMIRETLSHCTVPDDISQVIVVTQCPDRLSPCTAVDVHEFLNLPPRVVCFDVNHACDGWIIGLLIAQGADKTLLVCADRLRYGKDAPDNLIFSDCVSVTVVTPGLFSYFDSMTDGSGAHNLSSGLSGEMFMNGDAVFDFVTTKVPGFIKKAGSWDYLVPHQANMSMNRILAKRSGFDDRALSSIEEYGNQSMNSIPTCIIMHEKTLLGKQVLMCGFGAGFTAAMCGVSWPSSPVGAFVEIG